MADAYVQMPDDAANTGKKVRTNSRSVAGSTVHEHYNIIQDPTSDVQATVRGYTRGDPLAVALLNASGDDYLPVPEAPVVVTIPFRITSAGTTVIAGPYTGRVVKVCGYRIQAEADTAQCKFGSGASGEALTHQWLFNAREGVGESVSPLGGGYIFKTRINTSLVIENAGANVRGSVSFHTGDSF